MKRWLALLPALGLGGCTLDVCSTHPPAFELEISIDDGVEEPVRSFTVNVAWLDASFTKHYVVADELDDGLTSVGVELEPRPTEEVDLTIGLRAYAGEDTDSMLVAEDEEQFDLSPDGCNLFPIDIDRVEDER